MKNSNIRDFYGKTFRTNSNRTRKPTKKHSSGKTITLKIKYSDFTTQTRKKTLPYFIADKGLLFETTKELLYQERMKDSVRLLGISLSNSTAKIKKTIVVQLRFEF